MRRVTILFFIGLLISCGDKPEAAAPVEEPSVNATRGFWLTNVDSDALYSRAGIEEAVDMAVRYGFNTIYVVTWNKGYTLYPSQMMEEEFGVRIDPELGDRDPLRELIETAQAEDIRVVAWFEYGFASSYGQPEEGGHLLKKRPRWAARDITGNIVSKNNFQWMNAFDPAVQDFMLSLMKEVVENYDIDGVQGDDRLPALPSTAGYDSLSVARYREAHNGADPPEDHFDPEWIDWRAGLLNNFMERMHKELKALDEGLIISSAPSVYPWSKQEYLQDWPTWVRKGWVDEVLPQIYRYDISAYRGELQKIVQRQVVSSDLDKVFPGILLKVGSYVAEPALLEQMVAENRKYGIEGEVFFFYEGIKRRESFFEGLY